VAVAALNRGPLSTRDPLSMTVVGELGDLLLTIAVRV
jgi:hypothetical protein